MKLVESYKIVSRSIVAITMKRPPGMSVPPNIPPIIGTGFVVEEGLVATNDHVIQAAEKIPNFPGLVKSDWPIEATLFYLTQDQGVVQIGMQVLSVFTRRSFPRTLPR